MLNESLNHLTPLSKINNLFEHLHFDFFSTKTKRVLFFVLTFHRKNICIKIRSCLKFRFVFFRL